MPAIRSKPCPCKISEGHWRSWLSPLAAAFWIVLAVYLALVIGFAWNPTPLAQGLAAIGIAAACIHAALVLWLEGCARASRDLRRHHLCDGESRRRHGVSVRPLSFRSRVEPAACRSHPDHRRPALVRHGIFFLDCGRRPCLARAGAAEPEIRTCCIAHRRRIRDDAVGCGDGPARVDHFKSLDLARRRGAFRRSAFELSRLVTDLVAVLSGVRPLSQPPAPCICMDSRTGACAQAGGDFAVSLVPASPM